jgi:hypothetical protein
MKAMNEKDRFRSALWAFVGRQQSKTAAASELKVTRTDLYRYISGSTVPRPDRMRQMMSRMAAGVTFPASGASDTPPISEENVTQMRDMLLHLVSLLDLDLASRRVNERKGG